jgi:hypothetical protein
VALVSRDGLDAWLEGQREQVVALARLAEWLGVADPADAESLTWGALWRAYETFDPARGRSLPNWCGYVFRKEIAEHRKVRARRGRGVACAGGDALHGLTERDAWRRVRARIALEAGPPCLGCGTEGGATAVTGKAERINGLCRGCYDRSRYKARRPA